MLLPGHFFRRRSPPGAAPDMNDAHHIRHIVNDRATTHR